MDPSSTSSITEFAIVVAGFTGLVFAIGSKGGTANSVVKFRILTMLFYAFTAAFGSLAPTIAESFEVAAIWEFSAKMLIILLVANMIATSVSQRVLLTSSERTQLKQWMRILVYVGNSAFALLLAVTLSGGLALPITGVFFGALFWQLVLSSTLFMRLVMQG
jgi:hypothetical protein